MFFSYISAHTRTPLFSFPIICLQSRFATFCPSLLGRSSANTRLQARRHCRPPDESGAPRVLEMPTKTSEGAPSQSPRCLCRGGDLNVIIEAPLATVCAQLAFFSSAREKDELTRRDERNTTNAVSQPLPLPLTPPPPSPA